MNTADRNGYSGGGERKSHSGYFRQQLLVHGVVFGCLSCVAFAKGAAAVTAQSCERGRAHSHLQILLLFAVLPRQASL